MRSWSEPASKNPMALVALRTMYLHRAQVVKDVESKVIEFGTEAMSAARG